MEENTDDKFSQILQCQGKQFQEYIQNILRQNAQNKHNSKLLYTFMCNLLQSNITKQTILKIAQFIMILVMLGHVHILHEIIVYLLPTLVSLSSNVHRLSPLDPIRDKNKIVQPNKWKNQLACQFIHLMATWFPYNLFDLIEQSKFVKVIKYKKIIIKAYFILNSKFLTTVQLQVNKLEYMLINKGNGLQINSCVWCQKLIEKQTKKKFDKMFKSIQNNLGLSEIAPQNKQASIKIQKITKQQKNSNKKYYQKQNKQNISFFNDISLSFQQKVEAYVQIDYRIIASMKQKSVRMSKDIKRVSQKLLEQYKENEKYNIIKQH